MKFFTGFTVPASNFLEIGNLLSAASEVVLRAIEKGLALFNACKQKIVETAIESARKVFDGFCDITFKTYSFLDNCLNSFFEFFEEAVLLDLFRYFVGIVAFVITAADHWESIKKQNLGPFGTIYVMVLVVLLGVYFVQSPVLV